jgi:dihydrofolate reductase
VRSLTADLFLTVDGFARGAHSPAFFGYDGPDLASWIGEQMSTPHVIVMGANTYRALAEMSSDSGDDPMTAMSKIVFSRSLRPPLAWANTTLIADDVTTAVPALKRADGDPLRVIGSVSLVRSLLRLGLLDRLRLMVFPQLLGDSGREPAFAELPDIDLQLGSTNVLDGRLLLIEYVPEAPAVT